MDQPKFSSAFDTDEPTGSGPAAERRGSTVSGRESLGAAKLRVRQAAVDIKDSEPQIAYQHTVLCQTCLPYRDPGDDVRSWDRDNGKVALRLKAGEAMHPTQGWQEVGLPFGPKPRLILAYLNTYAIIHQTPTIEVESSLTGFVKRVGLDVHGRNIRTIKDQLGRLSATEIKLGIVTSENSAKTAQLHIVSDFDLWFPKDDRQRVLWPTQVTLGATYFQTLVEHAVPLEERALGALSHSATALDLYCWLAQRLHRVHPKEAAFVSWVALHRQFGQDHARVRRFRESFLVALRQVLAVYPDAKLEVSAGGLTLHHSAPPIPYRRITSERLTAKRG